MSAGRIEIGSRVSIIGLVGKKGEVKFIGRTKFAEGEWVGVVLETPDGKNDGSVGDVRYFSCEPLHGLFVKSAQVRLEREPVAKEVTTATDTSSRLAALREKRKQQEAESGTSATASTLAVSNGPSIATRSSSAVSSAAASTRRSSIEPGAPSRLLSSSSSAVAAKKAAEAVTNTQARTTAVITTRNSTLRSSGSTAPASAKALATAPKLAAAKIEDAAAPGPDDSAVIEEVEATSPSEPSEEYAEALPITPRHETEQGEDSNHLREEYDQLLQKFDSFRAERDMEVAKLEATVKDGEESISQLNGSIENLKAQLQTASHQNTKLQSDFNTRVTAYESELASLRDTKVRAEQQPAADAYIAKIADLEAQILELNDTIEMVTLDKEQLQLEKEILEENNNKLSAELEAVLSSQLSSEGCDGEANAPPAVGPSAESLREENGKLKDALKRLHMQYKEETELLKTKASENAVAIQNYDLVYEEVLDLRGKLAIADEKIHYLQEEIDSNSDFEQMIESLTEKNETLGNTVSELKLTIADLENDVELSEELDRQQRQEIDSLRRELDAAQVALNETDYRNKGIKDRLDDSKKTEEKFKKTIQSQRDEIALLQLSLQGLQDRLDHELERGRGTSRTRMSHVVLQQELAQLKESLEATDDMLLEAKSKLSRVGRIFSQCEVYVEEMSELAQEAKTIELTCSASKACSEACTSIDSKFNCFKQMLSDHIANEAQHEEQRHPTEDKHDDTLANRNIHILHRSSEAVLSLYLELLRAACLLWHYSSIVSFSRGRSNERAAFSDAVHKTLTASGMNSVLAAATTHISSIVQQNYLDEDSLLSSKSALKSSADSLEEFLFDSIRRNSESLIGFYKLSEVSQGKPSSNLFALDEQLFHSFVQISYFCHAILLLVKESCFAEDQSNHSENDRLDLIGRADAIDIAVQSMLKHLDHRIQCACSLGDGDDSSRITSDVLASLLGAVGKVRNTLKFAFDSAMSLVASPGSTDLDHSLDNLRVIEATISEAARHLIDPATFASYDETAVYANSVKDINICCEKPTLLWRWMTDSELRSVLPSMSSVMTNSSHSITVAPNWVMRCNHFAAQVGKWNEALANANVLQKRAENAEYECVVAKEQLRVSKFMCNELKVEMESLKSVSEQPTTTAIVSQSEEKLKKEIQMLTEALEVLEGEKETLEKENKALKKQSGAVATAGGAPPTTRAKSSLAVNTIAGSSSSSLWDNFLVPETPMNASSGPTGTGMPGIRAEETTKLLSRLLNEWRRVALRRIAGELTPLPTLPGMLTELGPKNDIERKGQSQISNARRIYREARQVRASIRLVNINSDKLVVTYNPNCTDFLKKNGAESLLKLEEHRKQLLCM